MGVLMAIDFGLKRSGLAITDNQKIIASPLESVNSIDLMGRILELLKLYQVDALILGYPTSLDGTDTHISENVRMFKSALEKECGILVILQNEQFSSKRATQAIFEMGKKKDLKNKSLVDKVSAAIILQDYMDGL